MKRRKLSPAQLEAATIAFACIGCDRRYPDHAKDCSVLNDLCLHVAPDGSLARGSPCVERRQHKGAHVYGAPQKVYLVRAQRYRAAAERARGR